MFPPRETFLCYEEEDRLIAMPRALIKEREKQHKKQLKEQRKQKRKNQIYYNNGNEDYIKDIEKKWKYDRGREKDSNTIEELGHKQGIGNWDNVDVEGEYRGTNFIDEILEELESERLGRINNSEENERNYWELELRMIR